MFEISILSGLPLEFLQFLSRSSSQSETGENHVGVEHGNDHVLDQDDKKGTEGDPQDIALSADRVDGCAGCDNIVGAPVPREVISGPTKLERANMTRPPETPAKTTKCDRRDFCRRHTKGHDPDQYNGDRTDCRIKLIILSPSIATGLIKCVFRCWSHGSYTMKKSLTEESAGAASYSRGHPHSRCGRLPFRLQAGHTPRYALLRPHR